MKTITILGTGWLGLELAKGLQNKYIIKVSSRIKGKVYFYENLGFESYLFNEEDFSNIEILLECDYLFINFPPSKFENYIQFLDTIYKKIEHTHIQKTIFVSSTSIYPKEDGIYTENFPIKTPTSKIVYEAEQTIKERTEVILRCAGLMGDDRIAGKYFANKEIQDSDTPVNHVHRVDVIRAVEFIIKEDINGVFNLVAPQHPTKKELYVKNASRYHFDSPIFLNSSIKNRIIDGSKLTKLGFQYKYDNPLLFD